MSQARYAEIQALAEAIQKHRQLYEEGRAEIADAAYDAMESRLAALQPQHPVLGLVGQQELSGQKVEHQEPMLSLNKTYELADLFSWAKDHAIVGSWKVDGVSLSLIYSDGSLRLAKTRGNGRVGEDVTAKILWLADIPQRLESTSAVEVRGELYCSEHAFAQLAEEMTRQGLDRPTSPRNIVAGLLGRKTQGELMRYFRFFAFDVRASGELIFTTEWEKIDWALTQGFAVPEPRLLQGEASIEAFLAEVRSTMAAGEIGLDGAVFSYNDLSLQQSLGLTAHHPRYKLSFKWQGQTATAKISRIDWFTSRLGIVTPVAVIEPVYLSGAQITNVTLHNAEHVRAYQLKAGDQIEVVRSGEVIPKFLRVIEAAPGAAAWIEACPTCGAALRFDEVRLLCPNGDGCVAQRLGVILNWVRAADIDDLSEKRLESLIDLELVRGPADLYALTLADFLKLPLTKEKMAAKLYQNIQSSKALPLPRFLVGLGIEGGGLSTWESLLDHFPSLADLQAASPAAIEAIPGFAAKSAQQIVDGLAAKAGLIEALVAAGIQPAPWARRAAAAGPLLGKTIAITGALSRPRAEIEDLLKIAGAKPASSVSSKTFALVCNELESSSSKLTKARELGIPIWDEAELLRKLAPG